MKHRRDIGRYFYRKYLKTQVLHAHNHTQTRLYIAPIPGCVTRNPQSNNHMEYYSLGQDVWRWPAYLWFDVLPEGHTPPSWFNPRARPGNRTKHKALKFMTLCIWHGQHQITHICMRARYSFICQNGICKALCPLASHCTASCFNEEQPFCPEYGDSLRVLISSNLAPNGVGPPCDHSLRLQNLRGLPLRSSEFLVFSDKFLNSQIMKSNPTFPFHCLEGLNTLQSLKKSHNVYRAYQSRACTSFLP